MKTIIIKESESNIRINKYLFKLLPNCSTNLLYKLIRKKYFKINNNIVKGDELLKTGDVISIFLSNDTYEKFINKQTSIIIDKKLNIDYIKERIVYEDDNIIVYNKIEGELSQKDSSGELSINEKLNLYLEYKKIYINLFKPSVINRLDVNTKGLIIFSKTYIAANILSKLFKDRKIDKFYFTYVNGELKKNSDILYGIYRKDENINKAYINIINRFDYSTNDLVITEYEVLKRFDNYTAVNIHLITGKSHQIRSHFSALGNPLICDKKYMDEILYNKNKLKFKRSYQDLTCYKIVLPKTNDLDKIGLSNKVFSINYGDIDKYEKI